MIWLAAISIVAVGMRSGSIAAENQNFCNAAISVKSVCSISQSISENILWNIVEHGKYCETSAIIETFGPGMK